MQKYFVMPLLMAGLLLTSAALFADSGSKSDFDTINAMLEYHHRMAGKIEAYLKERQKIPSDYQEVSDREFLKKAKAEKINSLPPVAHSEAPMKSKPQKSAGSVKASAPVAATPTPAPTPKKFREY